MSQFKPLDLNAALPYLWARHRIALLSDYDKVMPDPDNIKEVTRLGLEYNLLTEYTSFVAVDTLVRAKDGQVTTVKQPLPLPEGVSDYAVSKGMRMKSAGAVRGAPNGQSRTRICNGSATFPSGRNEEKGCDCCGRGSYGTCA